LATKFYRGPAQAWLNDAFGGFWYVWFFCLAVWIVWPDRPGRVCGGVFIGTAVVEFGQLWHPHWLHLLRQTLPGRLLLGTTFVWSDFLYYALGCLTAYWLLRRWGDQLIAPAHTPQ